MPDEIQISLSYQQSRHADTITGNNLCEGVIMKTETTILEWLDRHQSHFTTCMLNNHALAICSMR